MKKLTLPLAVAMVLTAVYVTLRIVAFDLIGDKIFAYLLAISLAAISVLAVRLINRLLFDVLFVRRSGREAPALLRGLLSIALYIAAFLLIYRTVLDREIGLEILATSTVLSVILGLALQDTLGNFFAGISLHVEQPFRILDSIRIGDTIGKVEGITWRTTTVRTNNNSLVVFPNSRVAREPIEIYQFSSLNRRVMLFPAPYSVAPERIASLVKEAVQSLPDVAPERTPIVRINSFSDSYVTYELLYWVKDYMLTPDLDAKAKERIWYVTRRAGIEIPLPTRHLLVEPLEPRTISPADDERIILESVEIFEPLTAEERESVLRSAVCSVYAPGEVILRRGDAGDSMFVVKKGKVEVRLTATKGDPNAVALIEAGGFFGEMGLLTGEPRTADVTALDEVEVWEIHKPALQQVLADNDQLVAALCEKVADRQAKLVEFARAVPEEEKQ